ncbi:MAG: sigma-70 family RNA polymerase sigma factor [Acidobacteriota bacterium]|nr:sigma-70 family RNA polymerase sigma factor [Acidobacteriota bacterium]
MAGAEAQDVTGLLEDWRAGDERALAKLWPLVYDELHGLAERYMRRERAGHTLQATALVNEAYMKLVDQKRVDWKSSLHFVALAAQMMRRILVDHARGRDVAKRGGGARRISLDQAPEIAIEASMDVVAVDEALQQLTDIDPQLGKIVELRFFGGMTAEEIAEFLGISVPTVTRRWRMAKAWLFRHLSGEEADGH